MPRLTIIRYLARTSRALTLVCAVAIGALFYFGHAVFIPVALALLFSLILSSAVEALHRCRLPRAVSAFLMLLILITAMVAVTDALIEPAQQWFESAPRTLQVVEKKIRPVERLMRRIEGLTSRAGQIGSGLALSQHLDNPTAPSQAMSTQSMLSMTGTTVVSVMTFIILTLFLLAGGPPMLARMAASVATDLHTARALRVIEAIRAELARYYGTIALINLGLGLATGAAMRLLGVPNPWLWGALAGVLNFIPYVGPATTLVVLSVVALVSFDQPVRMLAVIGSFLGLIAVEGQIIQPLLVGHRLALNPILVFLAVWFGGWFWGIPGIVIAVPSLVALKVAAEQTAGAEAVVEFLSPSDSLTLQGIHGQRSSASARLGPASPEHRRLRRPTERLQDAIAASPATQNRGSTRR